MDLERIDRAIDKISSQIDYLPNIGNYTALAELGKALAALLIAKVLYESKDKNRIFEVESQKGGADEAEE
ncbi:MAG: hypothetical protein NC517_08850 [Firmicutes bacterium]|nr:hypothetical protein [Bacillota bacterium]